MFGIGMPEMILILAVALIVIGPRKLPELAKSLGRAIGEFRRATTELKESMEIETEINEVRRAFDDVNDEIKETIDMTPADIEQKSPVLLPEKKEDAEKTSGKEKTAGDGELEKKTSGKEKTAGDGELEKKTPIVPVSFEKENKQTKGTSDA